MKNKQFNKYLKRKADEVEIKNYTQNILKNVNHTPKEVIAQPEIAFTRRKWFAPVVAFALAICLTVALIPSLLNRQAQQIEITSTEVVLADEIVTAGSLLTDTVNTVSLNLQENPTFNKNEIGFDIRQFLTLGNSFTDKNNVESKLYKNEDKNYKEYEYKLTVLDKSTLESYTLYYNEIESGKIKGKFLKGNKVFDFEAEFEKEEDESEVELTLFTGENSFVTISNSIEDDGDEYELEYSYEIVVNGKVITEVEMEFARENGKKESSVSVTNNTYFLDELLFSTQTGYGFVYSTESVSCTISIQGNDLTISIPVINGAFNFDESLLG